MAAEEKAGYACARVMKAALNVDRSEGNDANKETFGMNDNLSVT